MAVTLEDNATGVFGLCVDFLGESRLLIFSTRYVSVATNTIIIKQVTILYTTTATKYYTTTATLQKQQLNTLQKQLLNTLQKQLLNTLQKQLLNTLHKQLLNTLQKQLLNTLQQHSFHPWKVTLLESLLTLLMFNFFVLSLYWI